MENYEYVLVQQGIEIPSRVFVGRIPFNMKEDELAELFSSFGTVCDTKIITDRQGLSRGFGFVTFETTEEAQNALRQGKLRYNKSWINVGKAIRKQGGQFEKANQEYVNGQRQISLMHHNTGEYILNFDQGLWYAEPLNCHFQPTTPCFSMLPTGQLYCTPQSMVSVVPPQAPPAPMVPLSVPQSSSYPPQTTLLHSKEPLALESSLEGVMSQLCIDTPSPLPRRPESAPVYLHDSSPHRKSKPHPHKSTSRGSTYPPQSSVTVPTKFSNLSKRPASAACPPYHSHSSLYTHPYQQQQQQQPLLSPRRSLGHPPQPSGGGLLPTPLIHPLPLPDWQCHHPQPTHSDFRGPRIT